MRKKIWILNHYANVMFQNKGGRHYWFAENLIKQGYDPIIICSSFFHKGTENIIEGSEKIKIEYSNKIPFVFLKTDSYVGNGKARIKNMFQYFWQVLRNYKKIERKFGKPDIIIGSSVHPLACLAALILGKKYKIKKIIEIRDLWPETLLMMGIVKEKTLLSWLLYKGEKYLYKKADNIIFTMEGGKQYIIDKGWDKNIDLTKIYHINNGVDLDKFRELEKNSFKDEDLDNNKFKIIYTGTIAQANNLERIIRVAEELKENKDISFIIYGDGNQRLELEELIEKKKLENIIFKGRVLKEKIPYILSKADILLINYIKEDGKYSVFKYGSSHNKLFEYLASGKVILQTVDTGFDIVESNGCGVVLKTDKKDDDILTKEISEEIVKIKNYGLEQKKKISNNCKRIAIDYDFKNLTKKLIEVIEK